MTRRLLAFALAWLTLALPCEAQNGALAGVFNTSAAVTYVGPGDVVTGAWAWYGLRAYNAAYITGAKKAVNVRRASDSTTQDINVTATGALDIASAVSFAGTDATCTGTVATTTLTCTGASSTPHAGSTVAGAGVTQPSIIVSCGTFTAGAGTCTLSASSTVSVGETVTMTYGLFVAKLYDQSGNTNDVSQATAGNQPQLAPSCVNGLPCVVGNSTATMLLISASVVNGNQPITMSGVWNRTGSTSLFNVVINVGTSGGGNISTGMDNATNTAYISCGTVVTKAANDNAWHAVQSVCNTTSSAMNIDGTDFTSLSGGSNNPGTGTMAVANDASSHPFNGDIAETGVWKATAFNATQRGNLCHNQFTYWGTSTSC